MSVNDGGYKTQKNSTEQIFCENITNDHGQEKIMIFWQKIGELCHFCKNSNTLKVQQFGATGADFLPILFFASAT